MRKQFIISSLPDCSCLISFQSPSPAVCWRSQSMRWTSTSHPKTSSWVTQWSCWVVPSCSMTAMASLKSISRPTTLTWRWNPLKFQRRLTCITTGRGWEISNLSSYFLSQNWRPCNLTCVVVTICSHPHLQEVPPYNGFGSLEDSLQNCLSLIPEPPRKNVMKMLENNLKVLRYGVTMVSRRFCASCPPGCRKITQEVTQETHVID